MLLLDSSIHLALCSMLCFVKPSISTQYDMLGIKAVGKCDGWLVMRSVARGRLFPLISLENTQQLIPSQIVVLAKNKNLVTVVVLLSFPC